MRWVSGASAAARRDHSTSPTSGCRTASATSPSSPRRTAGGPVHRGTPAPWFASSRGCGRVVCILARCGRVSVAQRVFVVSMVCTCVLDRGSSVWQIACIRIACSINACSKSFSVTTHIRCAYRPCARTVLWSRSLQQRVKVPLEGQGVPTLQHLVAGQGEPERWGVCGGGGVSCAVRRGGVQGEGLCN